MGVAGIILLLVELGNARKSEPDQSIACLVFVGSCLFCRLVLAGKCDFPGWCVGVCGVTSLADSGLVVESDKRRVAGRCSLGGACFIGRMCVHAGVGGIWGLFNYSGS